MRSRRRSARGWSTPIRPWRLCWTTCGRESVPPGLPVADYTDARSLGERVLADLTALVEARFPAGALPSQQDRDDAVHAAFAQVHSAQAFARPAGAGAAGRARCGCRRAAADVGRAGVRRRWAGRAVGSALAGRASGQRRHRAPRPSRSAVQRPDRDAAPPVAGAARRRDGGGAARRPVRGPADPSRAMVRGGDGLGRRAAAGGAPGDRRASARRRAGGAGPDLAAAGHPAEPAGCDGQRGRPAAGRGGPARVRRAAAGRLHRRGPDRAVGAVPGPVLQGPGHPASAAHRGRAEHRQRAIPAHCAGRAAPARRPLHHRRGARPLPGRGHRRRSARAGLRPL